MTGRVRTTTVNGKTYKVWSDTNKRATYAENEAGEVKAIRTSGYITNDLTTRKAIALVFGLTTFKR